MMVINVGHTGNFSLNDPYTLTNICFSQHTDIWKPTWHNVDSLKIEFEFFANTGVYILSILTSVPIPK